MPCADCGDMHKDEDLSRDGLCGRCAPHWEAHDRAVRAMNAGIYPY